MMQRLLDRKRRLPTTPLPCPDDDASSTDSCSPDECHKDSPLEVMQTQEVIWKDSPRPYRPLLGQQSYREVLQRELSNISDLLADKENSQPSQDSHAGLLTPAHRGKHATRPASSSFLGHLLGRRSPLAPPTPSCSSASSSFFPSPADQTPSSISSSGRKRPRPSEQGPSSSPRRHPQGIRRGGGGGGGLMAAPPGVGSTSGLGALARSFRQGRFRLNNLWRKNHNPAIKQEGEEVSPCKTGDGAREFLNILEQVEERLSQEEDSRAVQAKAEGIREEHEGKVEETEKEEAKPEQQVAYKKEEETPPLIEHNEEKEEASPLVKQELPEPKADSSEVATTLTVPPPAAPQQKKQGGGEDEFSSFTADDWEKIFQMEHSATQLSQPPCKRTRTSPPPQPKLPAVSCPSPAMKQPQHAIFVQPPPPRALCMPTNSCSRPLSSPPRRKVQAATIEDPRISYSQRRAGDGNLAFPYRRYKAIEVHDDKQRRVKTIVATAKPAGDQHKVVVSGPWYDALVEKHTVFHVVSTAPGSIDPCLPPPCEEQGGLSVVQVDNQQNFLIVHPDTFVSPSSIVAATECDRKAILQDRVSSSMSSSSAAVLGQLKHTLFQDMLVALNDDTNILRTGNEVLESAESMVTSIIAKRRLSILGAQLTEETVHHELTCIVRPIVEWARACFLGRQLPRQPKSELHQIVKIEATTVVEENIWSAGLGVKGQIDASLRVRPLQHDFRKACLPSQCEAEPPHGIPEAGSVLVPLELKTGRRSMDLEITHKAQVLLYALLLRDRYGSPQSEDMSPSGYAADAPPTPLVRASRAGFLAYVDKEEVKMDTVLPDACSIRHLLAARNRVAAASLTQHEGLPPVHQSFSTCSRCFKQSECMVYHKAREDGGPNTTAVPSYFLAATSAMGPADIEYFNKWDRLIDLEAKHCAPITDLWHRSGMAIEESYAKCMGDMVCVDMQVRAGIEGNSYLYSFGRRTWAGDPQVVRRATMEAVPRSLLELSVGVGDRVLVSSEARVISGSGEKRPFRHVNVCNGNIINVTDSIVEVSCSRPMNLPGVADPSFTQPPKTPRSQPQGGASVELAYEGVGLYNRGSSSDRGPLCSEQEMVVFRLDKDSSSINFATMRENLVRLFTGHAVNQNPGKGLKLEPNPGDEQRRRLIVQLEPPRFDGLPSRPVDPASLFRSPRLTTLSGCSPAELMQEYDQLNSDQKEAVERVITAEDYMLLRGMPGTGKTATIAFVVRTLVCRGARVLITSYTHSAVDNLLLKLRSKGVPFLRVGRPSSVHPALHDAILDVESTNNGDLPTVSALQARLRSTKVLACTCLGMRDPIFALENYDYCIVDEAGQICQPVCLGPIRAARVFVLVGDDNQLPPVISSPEAREGGMDESLFTRLANAHPHSVQRLSYQYRMNQDIMTICNELIYQNQLKCGNTNVAESCLELSCPDRLQLLCSDCDGGVPLLPSTGWLESVLDPDRRVVFLDTDGISAQFLEEGRALQGKGQESLANCTNPTEARLVCQLVTGLVLAGILPEAVAVISPLRSQNKVMRRLMSQLRGVEVNTVDKYQGMDKDCIILSLVRSNADGVIGKLLKDRRRINVAISRAKRKLILVGSSSTLSSDDTFTNLFHILQQRGWVYRLPHQAPAMYDEKSLDVVSELCNLVGSR